MRLTHETAVVLSDNNSKCLPVTCDVKLRSPYSIASVSFVFIDNGNSAAEKCPLADVPLK